MTADQERRAFADYLTGHKDDTDSAADPAPVTDPATTPEDEGRNAFADFLTGGRK